MKWSTWFWKDHSFSPQWKEALWSGALLGLGLALLMIVLQPFDTYTFQSPFKNLLLLGYAPCILVGTLAIHPIEAGLYRKQDKHWYLWNEILILLLGGLLMMSFSYAYNTLVINGYPVNFSEWWEFLTAFGSPFFIFLGPIWGFVRSRLGRRYQASNAPSAPILLQIVSQNKKESFQLAAAQFIYAQAQQNYTEIFYQAESGEVVRKILRISVSRLQAQIPSSQQIHRSYLINPDFLEEIQGNARKRFVQLKMVPTPLPLSPKYYETIQKGLSNSAQ